MHHRHSADGDVSPRTIALAAALILAAASAACGNSSSGSGDRGQHDGAARAELAAGINGQAEAGVPMTAAAARRLPAGVFYILGGPRASSMNVWQVSRNGGLLQLTRNPAGLGIDEMSASAAGVVVGDGLSFGEQDGILTSRGVVWVRPWHKPHGFIYGFGVHITAAGQLVYLLAPGQGTDPASKVFTYWLKPSLTGRERQIYHSRLFAGEPLPGPKGQVAIVGPSGLPAPGQRPGIVVISRSGHSRTPPAGVKEIGYPPLWGLTARALVIPSAHGPAHLIFMAGRRLALPDGWQPWSWNPTGTALLMLRGTTLGSGRWPGLLG